MWWWFALGACIGGGDRPAPVERGESYSLAGGLPFSALELPLTSRSEPVPVQIPISGWTRVGVEGGWVRWAVPLPVRLRSLFFSRPPAGMRVVGRTGEVLPHQSEAPSGAPSWAFGAEMLAIALPVEEASPEGRYFLEYPDAVRREQRLNRSTAGLDDATFALQRAQVGPYSYAGVFMPAPAVVSWELTVPPAAELLFRPGLVESEVADGRSDGARLTWEVVEGGASTRVWTAPLIDPPEEMVRVNLEKWAGKAVTLRALADPAGGAERDYVFVAEPRLASRLKNPRRAVLLFIDTLRRDHLGLYGYPRDPAPAVGALAEGAAVFESARSVAPWTLPSARSLVSGRYPDEWQQGPTLPQRLSDEGWATGFFAGNVYLSSNFEMDQGWSHHRVVNWPLAEEQVDQALRWWEEEDGHDALLLVQFMDLHLPYTEPAAYRFRYAGPRPAGMESDRFTRGLFSKGGVSSDTRQWVRDRYDNNLAYVSDQIARIQPAIDASEVVVTFADHGEEFWDHGAFEHGHSLFDELLRVPLILSGPGVPAGRVEEAVTLLDVAPTVGALLGLPPDPSAQGRDLGPFLRGERPWEETPRALGWPLYGSERWGLLADGHKYGVFEGRESLWDLEKDPEEKRNLFADVPGDVGAPWRPKVAAALGRPFAAGYRLDTPRQQISEDLVAEMTVPGGVLAAWLGADPTETTRASVEVEGDVVRVTWPGGGLGGREVFVVPKESMEATTHALRVTARMGTEVQAFQVDEKRDALPGRVRTPIGRTRIGGTQVVLTYGIGAPPPDLPALSGFREDVRGELEALGYLE